MAKAKAKASARIPMADALPKAVARAERPLALWRGLFFDLPLMWAMEVSRFGGHLLQAQAEHWTILAGCSAPGAAMDAQSRFLKQSAAELTEKVGALAREARLAAAV